MRGICVSLAVVLLILASAQAGNAQTAPGGTATAGTPSQTPPTGLNAPGQGVPLLPTPALPTPMPAAPNAPQSSFTSSITWAENNNTPFASYTDCPC